MVNESATERMIRELREENARLQDLMKGGGGSSVSLFLYLFYCGIFENVCSGRA